MARCTCNRRGCKRTWKVLNGAQKSGKYRTASGTETLHPVVCHSDPETMLKTLYAALLPGCCLLCGLASRRDHVHGDAPVDLCEFCERDLPWNLYACGRCGLPLDESLVGPCAACRGRNFPFDAVSAPFLYQNEIARLLSRGKFQAGFSGLALVAELVASQCASNPELPDALVPVPISWRRNFTRGFNQSSVIARCLSRHLGIPVKSGLLRRRHHAPPQSQLSRRARLRNLVGAFEVRDAHKGQLEGRTVALVDDVLTTGATALACSKVLKKAGAGRVLVWVCARTPAP